jgi:DNA-binding phage protein
VTAIDTTTENQIIQAYRSGRRVRSIASSFQIATQTIYKVLSRRGEPVREHAPMTPGQVAEIVAAYQGGRTVRLIAEDFGITKEAIYYHLKGAGVPRRRRPGGKQVDFSPEDMERIKELRLQGWSKQELYDEFKCSGQRIDRALDALGLPKRMRRRDAKERVISGEGYALVLVPADDPVCGKMRRSTPYLMEHRVVMARTLGRPLRRDESVHHINGDRLDNRIENLQLRQGKHGRGIVMACNSCGSHDIVAQEIATLIATKAS